MIYKQINRHRNICFEMAFLQPLTKRTRKWHYGSKKIAIIIVRRFGPIPSLYTILAMTIYKHSTSQFFIRFGLHFLLPQGKYQSKHSLMCLTHCQFFWHWSLSHKRNGYSPGFKKSRRLRISKALPPVRTGCLPNSFTKDAINTLQWACLAHFMY